NWQSVICWGIFEEITAVAESEMVMQKIIDAMSPHLANSANAHPSHGITDNQYDIGTSKDLIIYKIKITKKSGRFEQEG
ncbi:MAG: pyridoxamine 5'-phosphate oxidase family protein, partial [Mucilaginibacter sp.]